MKYMVKSLKSVVVLMLLITATLHAQSDQIEAKSIRKAFEAEGINKAQIFTGITDWFAKEENAANNEISVADKENGHIVVKGMVKVLFKNIGTELYPKRSGMAEVLEAKFNHVVTIDIVDNAYTVTYTLLDMIKEMYGQEETFFNCVNFVEIDEEALEQYNKSMEKVFKRNFVFKNKREIFFENSRSQFQEVSSFILNEAQVNMYSLHEEVISGYRKE